MTQTDKPYSLGPFETITNVHFGNDVIVVFVDLNVLVPAGLSSALAIQDKATFLKQFRVDVANPGLGEASCAAYKVSADAGEFMGVKIAPGIPAPDANPDFFYCFVFAMSGDQKASLDQAIAGTRLLMPAVYLETHSADDVTPMKVDPPGLLWSVGLPSVPAGKSFVWKIRYGDHRPDAAPSPPNKMVQCYPLSNPWTFNGVTYSGYQIRVYRLDPKGTGTSYGGDLNPVAALNPPGGHMPAAWRRPIAGDGTLGVPFGDPPPLVGSDPPSS